MKSSIAFTDKVNFEEAEFHSNQKIINKVHTTKKVMNPKPSTVEVEGDISKHNYDFKCDMYYYDCKKKNKVNKHMNTMHVVKQHDNSIKENISVKDGEIFFLEEKKKKKKSTSPSILIKI